MPTAELDLLLHDAELAHGHLCAGQILGVRMAVLACRLLDIHDPRSRQSPDRKRLVTFVEIDRCATDAIAVVTGCRVGKRALKLRDWGKMAATFLDLARPIPPAELAGQPDHFRALRLVALESSKDRARELFPANADGTPFTDKNQQQMRAYRDLPDADLFAAQWVSVHLPPSEFPGFRGARVTCSVCGEGINFDRFTLTPPPDPVSETNDTTAEALCRGCADLPNRYYQPLPGPPPSL